MLKFLREDQLAPYFRSEKKGAWELMIAAPFWGKGAAKMLGLAKEKDARVICNLESNACNPYAIKEILQIGLQVRSHRRLHAKIYLTDDFAIIGSSNVSAYGLTMEGDNQTGLIEANVAIHDPEFVKTVTRFFDEVWVGSVEVTPAVLRKSLERWDRRPPPPPPIKSNTLLSACRDAPSAFRHVFVAPYDDELSGEAKEKLKAVQQQSAVTPDNDVSNLSQRDFKSAWGYHCSGIKPGSWLLFLDVKNPDKPKVGPCGQVALNLKIKNQADLAIVPRGVVEIPEWQRKFRVSSAEKEALIRNATRILKKAKLGFMPLAEAIRIIDSNP